MEKLHKNIWLVLIFVLSIDFVLIYFQNFFIFKSDNLDLVNRGIESKFKLITNGYFALFLNIKYVGLFSWLIIPIGIYYSNKNKYNIFLFTLFIIIALTIGFLGYINFRYAYTLTIPIQLVILFFLFSHNFFENKKFTFVYVSLYFIHFVFFAAIDLFPKYYKRIHSSSETNYNEKNIYSFIDQNINAGSVFLVNNIPQFYYYTHQFGYFYWCKDDELFLKDKKIKPLSTDNLNSVHKKLKLLKINYIFSDTLFDTYSNKFHEYVKNYTTPVYRQERLVVYQLNN